MKISLSSNLASLTTIRNLDQSTKALSQSFERLSSGLRINRAADDAAGLAISEREGTQVKVLQQASRNINDGTSLLSIADAAAGQISSMLVRMAELAEQAASGSISNSQRDQLDQEYLALDAEIRRIADSTEFNGIAALQGESSTDQGTAFDSSGLNNFVVRSVSGNGRFSLYTEGTADLIVYDHETGTSKSAFGGLISVSNAFVLDNGDVVFGDSALPGVVPLRYFDYDQETVTTYGDSNSGSDLRRMAVSADGSTIVFSSLTSYDDGQDIQAGRTGVDANPSIYVLDVESGIVNKFTDPSITGVDDFQVSANGDYVSFTSQDDITGGNADGGTELFLLDTSSDDITVTQLTSVAGNVTSHTAGVNNDGTVTFRSNLDLLGNGNSASQIFTVDANGSYNQATRFASGGIFFNGYSVDGSTVYLSSTSDFVGENPSGNTQIFAVDTSNNSISQISNLDGTNSYSNGRVSSDGTRLIQVDNTGTKEVLNVDLSKTARSVEIETGYGDTQSNVLALVQDLKSSLDGLGGTVISSQTAALTALDRVSDSIDALGILRGELGAGLSRLQTAHNVTEVNYTELENAVSQIRDVDVAFEAAELTRNTILQQGASSVLAQANQQPALVLGLLQS